MMNVSLVSTYFQLDETDYTSTHIKVRIKTSTSIREALEGDERNRGTGKSNTTFRSRQGGLDLVGILNRWKCTCALTEYKPGDSSEVVFT